MLAHLRFGYGLSAMDSVDLSPEALLAGLQGPDPVVKDWPIPSLTNVIPILQKAQRLRPESRKDPKKLQQLRAVDAEIAQITARAQRHSLAQVLDTQHGFAQRLVAFWANHFTVVSARAVRDIMVYTFVEDAIRPNYTARFADLLAACTLDPAMLLYLDQVQSVGPNSPLGKRRGFGLNENLAREVLELHSLGVGAAYGQKDVREMAEALTGITFNLDNGLEFQLRRAEPGAEVVLGKTYDGSGFAGVRQILADLARRPETAAHICRKLAVHFVADRPDPALIAAMEAAWHAHDGALLPVYAAMLGHPSAWSPTLQKARQPIDFILAALRGLGVTGAKVVALEGNTFKHRVLDPLARMGQPLKKPAGPDGWPEGDAAWITPQGLAARITWAMTIPGRMVAPLPEGPAFARTVLAERADGRLMWAVQRAESQREAVGLVLASAEFNRR